jgi:hypothetical protein
MEQDDLRLAGAGFIEDIEDKPNYYKHAKPTAWLRRVRTDHGCIEELQQTFECTVYTKDDDMEVVSYGIEWRPIPLYMKDKTTGKIVHVRKIL